MRIGEIVGAAPVFTELARLARLDGVIGAALPAELRPHYRIGRCAGGTLTLYAGSSVWATRLRYFAPILLERLRRRPRAPAIQEIRVRVLVPAPANPLVARTGPVLSAAVSAYLCQAAASFQDERLRSALLSLSKHGPV